jgi:hypothetical protein
LVAVSLFYFNVPIAAEEPIDLKAKFLAEAPKAWRELTAFADKLEGTGVVEATGLPSGTTRRRFEVLHNGSCRSRLSQSLVPRDPSGDLFAVNTVYAFSLHRKSADLAWVVTAVEERRPGKVGNVEYLVTDGMAALRPSVVAFATELNLLIASKTFRVDKVAQVKIDGEELVQIDFTNEHDVDPKQNPFDPTQRGTLHCDPEHRWCLREYRMDEKYTDGESLVTGKLKVKYTESGYPLPLRLSVKNEHKEDKKVYTITTEFDLNECTDLPPDDRFTLSAYGLPEPFAAKAARKKSSLYFWFGAGGVLCIALGTLLHRVRRRAVDTSAVIRRAGLYPA